MNASPWHLFDRSLAERRTERTDWYVEVAPEAHQELYRAAEHDRFDALEDLGLFDCIECGCCDVVCPSHIRLTESFRDGKRRFMHAMDHDARLRWIDAREQLRHQRVERWEAEHGPTMGAVKEPQPVKKRLEALTDIVTRVNCLSENEG